MKTKEKEKAEKQFIGKKFNMILESCLRVSLQTQWRVEELAKS